MSKNVKTAAANLVNNGGVAKMTANVPANNQTSFTADDLIAAKAKADNSAVDTNDSAVDSTGKEVKSFTIEELKEFATNIAKTATEGALEQAKKEFAATQAAKQEELDNKAKVEQEEKLAEEERLKAQQAAEQAEKDRDRAINNLDTALNKIKQLEEGMQRLEGLNNLYGVSNSQVQPGGSTELVDATGQALGAPMINKIVNPLQGPVGEAKMLVEMLQGTPGQMVTNSTTNTVAIQRDLKDFNNNIARLHWEEAKNGRSYKDSVLFKDLERSMKNEGFLSGGRVQNAAGPTIGTPGSVGVLYLDILAAWMRLTHNATNIWWQFPIQVYDPSTIPSLTMGIPRWEYLTEPSDINDFLLATTSTYTASPVSVGTATDSQALVANTVPIAIAEWGLGKNIDPNSRPVFIPEFHEQTSLFSLMSALDSRLMQSYYRFENKKIRLEFEKATTILYNENGYVTTTPGDVGTDEDGTFTHTFLNSIYTTMFEQQVPTLPDGCYMGAINPQQANQLKASLEKLYAPVTEQQRMEISNVLASATGVEIGRVNGYLGKYQNVHIFNGNDFGVGTAGSVPTVNDVVFGSGTFPAGDGFFFGPGAVGRGIALAAEIRASGTNPFGRGESYIWLSREETAPIDLDSTLDPAQQTRCFRARTAFRPL